jgi:hypothetical protein
MEPQRWAGQRKSQCEARRARARWAGDVEPARSTAIALGRSSVVRPIQNRLRISFVHLIRLGAQMSQKIRDIALVVASSEERDAAQCTQCRFLWPKTEYFTRCRAIFGAPRSGQISL